MGKERNFVNRDNYRNPNLNNTPCLVASPARKLAQAEFGDQIERTCGRHLEFLLDYSTPNERPRQGLCDEPRQFGVISPPFGTAQHLLPRQGQAVVLLQDPANASTKNSRSTRNCPIARQNA
jgi:hypothetical protein